MAVVVAVVLQGKYSALWTLIAGMSFNAVRDYSVTSCSCTLINRLSILRRYRWCSSSVSFTFQDWTHWQWHCNMAGHSACRPLPVHLLATYACGCSSTYRLLHLPQGKPFKPCWVHPPACIPNCWAVQHSDVSHTENRGRVHTSHAGYLHHVHNVATDRHAALTVHVWLLQMIYHVLVFAFLIVIASTALMTPILLYVFDLRGAGWMWQHAALFSAMIAPTDAVSVSSILKKGMPAS